jgi:cellobiose phosphorylase
MLRVQCRTGEAMHQFNPKTMIANEGDSREREDGQRFYGDDHLWAVLAICEYVKESGDIDFLQRPIPFYEKNADEKPEETAPVMEHVRRAIQFTRENTGRHGLPLLGFADWNDTVNLGAGAESCLVATLYGLVLRELSALLPFSPYEHFGDRCREYYDEMKERFNECAWDGRWFVRYFDADGTPLGSHRNTAGKIYTNGQSWPVISGFAQGERARMALDSVAALLNTANGIKLSAPGYDRFDPAVGGITTYPPGAKENGGIFLHANPWVIIAETMLGNGDRAYRYYEQITPAAKNDRIEEYECEPYVYAQNILGDEHPRFGCARNSWLTGTAAWAYTAATRYILGIRPCYDGLCIDPCIPSRWDGFRATRYFRGARYEITVENPGHICKNIKTLTIDGQQGTNRIVPVLSPGATHRINAVIG